MRYLGILIFYTFYVSADFATHGHWTDHYQNATGITIVGLYTFLPCLMRNTP